jgi:hypothetical protein
LNIGGLSDFLKTLYEKLSEYVPLMKCTGAVGTEDKLHTVLYPTVYIELVKFIYESLYPIKDNISSDAIKQLTREQQEILTLRYKKDLSQAKTGEILGITQVKVSREEKKILEKLRCLLS